MMLTFLFNEAFHIMIEWYIEYHADTKELLGTLPCIVAYIRSLCNITLRVIAWWLGTCRNIVHVKVVRLLDQVL